MKTPTFWLYDRWGDQLGTVIPQGAVRKVEVGGDHTLTITAVAALSKGERILFNDGARWREFVVSCVESERAEGLVVTTATCEDSICELNGDFIEDKRPEGNASKCLESALSSSRWEVGTVDVTGSALVSMYHQTAREAVNAVAEAFSAEVSATITVSGAKVTHRYVNLLARTGEDTARRFTYAKDLLSVTRTVALDDVCTALYGYGKGVALTDESGEETGGYSRKITFGDINGGLDYVASTTALEQWGRPDGSGGKAHVFGVYENSDCEDMEQLLAETKAELERLSEPQVAYEARVVDLKAAGFDAEGVGEGDGVAIVDECFDPPLRLTGRVLAMTVDYLAPENDEITLGNIRDVTDTMAEWQAQLGGLSSHSATWDAAGSVTSGYIAAVVKQLNQQFNAGGSYKFESFEQGSIWASVPLDEDGKPTKTPATAIQLCGLGFRIASSVDEDGEFEWTTFGTGEGFTASVLNAGVIKGGSNYWNLETGDLLFKQGGIRDSEGKNYWNLDTGEFSLSANATANGTKLGSTVVKVEPQYGTSASTSTEPTNWTNNALWSSTNPYMWHREKLTYIDGTTGYTTARRITSANGLGGVKTVPQWALSTSNSTAPTTGWSDTMQTWVSGRYYWTRNVTTWSDGTTTTDTPVLAKGITSANQAVDDLDDDLDQEGVFNRLTNNSANQGIYLSSGKVYINSSYIKTGTLSAGIIKDAAGRNTWNLNTGALTTNYMTATNATVKGTFECGSTYGIKLNSSGQMAGFRNGTQVGYIDFSSASTYIPTGATLYGLQLQASGIVRISSPKISTAATSNVSTTATVGSTGYFYAAGFDSAQGDGWSLNDLKLYSLQFINGICVSGNVN